MGNIFDKNDDKNSSSTITTKNAGDQQNKPLLSKVVLQIVQGCSDGGVLNLNVKNEKLMSSNNSMNRIINDEMMPELCDWIVKIGEKAKKLDNSLRANNIASNGASILFDALRSSESHIKVVDLGYRNKIGDECMTSLGKYIKSNPFIEEMHLSGTKITDSGIETLAPYLNRNTTFKHLELFDNEGITDKSIESLVIMIETSHMEHIGIKHTSIGQSNALVSALARNMIKYKSSKLFLSESDINDDDLIVVCGLMRKYGIDKLKEVNMQTNKITSKGAAILFDTLRECNTVVSILILSSNRINDDGMIQLGEYIENNNHLEILYLRGNDIKDKGIEILSEYLIGNTTMKELYFSECRGITDVSSTYLIDVVRSSCLTKIETFYTKISYDRQKEIERMFDIPINEREIPIKSNTKSAAKISSTSTST